MYNNNKIIAIIPARSGSKGLPRKNILDLCGKPLIAWSIDTAKESAYLDRVIVSTDSEEIANIAKNYDCEVPFIRPKELASDTASSIDVILHAINHFENNNEYFDYILLLEPTSPLRTVEDIDNPIKNLIDNKDAESLVSVAKQESAHPEFSVIITKNGLIQPFINKKKMEAKRRQDLKEAFYFEGTIYLSKVSAIKIKKSFYHDKTLPYIVERYKALEIDEINDLICAEALMKWKKEAYK